MPIFIKLAKKERLSLFKSVKKNINSSWENFYPSLRISRPMFFNYLSGKHLIPKDIFLKFKKIAKIDVIENQEVYKKKYVLKKFVPPKKTPSLAEILGILNGDGHITRINYEICVVGNLLEKDYFYYLKNLFENTFKLEFTINEYSTHFKLRTYSKWLFHFLIEEYALPQGNKLGKLKIPPKLLNSDILLISYIRGLFYTDGGFNLRRIKDPMVHITSADPIFLEQIKNALIRLNFKVSKTEKKVTIYQKEMIKRFFEDIKPANSKHLKKYQSYLNLYGRG